MQSFNRGQIGLVGFFGLLASYGQAEIVEHSDFQSKFVIERNVTIWIPDNVDTTKQRLRVIYTHDGQNLFDPDQAYTETDWGVDETLQKLIDSGEVEPTMVVGIWNTWDTRWLEYLPYPVYEQAGPLVQAGIMAQFGKGAQSREYLRFIVEELKPWVDANYPTHPEREHTLLMGSSMGGLISLYALTEHPEVFSGVAGLSTHWPLAGPEFYSEERTRAFIDYLRENLPAADQTRIYFDHGDQGLDQYYPPLQALVDVMMQERGYTDGENWMTRAFPGTGHAERYWRARLDVPLKFLLRSP